MDYLEFQLDKFNLRVPTNRQFTSDDLWIKLEENIAEIGITDYLQTNLGDILFFTPEKNSKVKNGQLLGVIESIKANMEINSPIGGKVISFNELLDQHPEYLGTDPYNKGWIVRIEVDSHDLAFKNLLSPKEYYSVMQEKAEKAARS